MASSSSRPELPDVSSSFFQEWVTEAAAEFGSNFREEFGHGWVYYKADIYRGKKVRKDVADVFNAMWEALEQRFPTLYSSETSLNDWPQWPVERELQQMSAASLLGQKISCSAGDVERGITSASGAGLNTFLRFMGLNLFENTIKPITSFFL